MERLFADYSAKTYKTQANAVKAAELIQRDSKLKYVIAVNEEGRFFPVFIGQNAFSEGTHFHHPTTA